MPIWPGIVVQSFSVDWSVLFFEQVSTSLSVNKLQDPRFSFTFTWSLSTKLFFCALLSANLVFKWNRIPVSELISSCHQWELVLYRSAYLGCFLWNINSVEQFIVCKKSGPLWTGEKTIFFQINMSISL